jgi:hypothetical protein
VVGGFGSEALVALVPLDADVEVVAPVALVVPTAGSVPPFTRPARKAPITRKVAAAPPPSRRHETGSFMRSRLAAAAVPAVSGACA